MTDPPLLSILASHVARRRGSRVINWLQDIYPEIAMELGVPFLKGPVSRILTSARDASLRRADVNVVVGERMSEKVARFGVSLDRIITIPNWCDDQSIAPVSPAANPLRTEWNLKDKFVVGYSGNLGRAHEFDTVLAASERLKDNQDIVFVFIGGGYQINELAQRVESRGLKDKFRFLPYQSDAVLQYSLSAPDVHWVSLRPALEGLIVPSKVYGIAAAGRPIIAIGAQDGEVARLVRAFDCGITIEPGRAGDLATAIVQLSTRQDWRTELGRKARAMLDTKFTRRHAFERWSQVVRSMLEMT